MTKTHDVAIMGFGPVGAVLAALLGRAGIDTVVIDKADDIFPLPRAIAFDHEIMRVLQGLGLAEAVAPHVRPYPPTEYHGLGGTVIARYQSLPPPYPQGWEPGFVFTQPPLGPDGSAGTVSARYAVACDGGASPVRKLLDIRLESLDFDEPWLVVDILVNPDKLAGLPGTMVQYCDPKRPATHVVGPHNHRRWEIMLLPGESPEEMAREAVIWQLLGRWLTPADGKLWRAATYVFHALVAEEWRRGRVLLAGDAAHMTPPFMAQGMCQGIRDAANLAWKLGLVLAGTADESLLDSYQAERRPHVRATTETAKAMGRIICELDADKARDRDARMLAEWGNPPAIRYRQDLIPGLLHGALWHEQGEPVGQRFPQPRIATADGPQLLDDVAGTGFRLLLSPQIAASDVPARLRSRLAELGGAILALKGEGTSRRAGPDVLEIVETEGLLAQWLGAHGLMATLVRPDHYVGAVARQASELSALPDVIGDRILRRP